MCKIGYSQTGEERCGVRYQENIPAEGLHIVEAEKTAGRWKMERQPCCYESTETSAVQMVQQLCPWSVSLVNCVLGLYSYSTRQNKDDE